MINAHVALIQWASLVSHNCRDRYSRIDRVSRNDPRPLYDTTLSNQPVTSKVAKCLNPVTGLKEKQISLLKKIFVL